MPPQPPAPPHQLDPLHLALLYAPLTEWKTDRPGDPTHLLAAVSSGLRMATQHYVFIELLNQRRRLNDDNAKLGLIQMVVTGRETVNEKRAHPITDRPSTNEAPAPERSYIRTAPAVAAAASAGATANSAGAAAPSSRAQQRNVRFDTTNVRFVEPPTPAPNESNVASPSQQSAPNESNVATRSRQSAQRPAVSFVDPNDNTPRQRPIKKKREEHFTVASLLFESRKFVEAALLAKKIYNASKPAASNQAASNQAASNQAASNQAASNQAAGNQAAGNQAAGNPVRKLQMAQFFSKCALALEFHTVMTCASNTSPEAHGKFEDCMKMFVEAVQTYRSLVDDDKPSVKPSWNIKTDKLPTLLRPLANYISPKKLRAELAECYINLSCVLDRIEKRDEAITILKKALSVLQQDVYPNQDNETIATCLHNIGVLTDVHQNKKEDAAWYLQKSIEMRRRLYADIDGYHEHLADSLHAFGAVLERLGHRYQGVKSQIEAANKYRGIFHGRRGSVKVASALNSIGVAVERYGDVKIGITLKRDALNMLRDLFPNGQNELLAAVCDSLGVSLEQAGETDEGVRLKREALAMREEIFKEDHADLAASLNNVASSLERIGDRARGLELRRKSRAMYERLYKSSGAESRVEPKEGGKPASVNVFDLNLTQAFATVLQGTGVAEEACGDKKKAKEYHLLALRLCEQLYNGKANAHLASAYNNVGTMLYNIGEDKAKGKEYLFQALKMRRELYGTSDNSLFLETVSALFNCDIPHEEGLKLADEFRPMLKRLQPQLQKPQYSYFLTSFALAYEKWGFLSTAHAASADKSIEELHAESRKIDAEFYADRTRVYRMYGSVISGEQNEIDDDNWKGITRPLGPTLQSLTIDEETILTRAVVPVRPSPNPGEATSRPRQEENPAVVMAGQADDQGDYDDQDIVDDGRTQVAIAKRYHVADQGIEQAGGADAVEIEQGSAARAGAPSAGSVNVGDLSDIDNRTEIATQGGSDTSLESGVIAGASVRGESPSDRLDEAPLDLLPLEIRPPDGENEASGRQGTAPAAPVDVGNTQRPGEGAASDEEAKQRDSSSGSISTPPLEGAAAAVAVAAATATDDKGEKIPVQTAPVAGDTGIQRRHPMFFSAAGAATTGDQLEGGNSYQQRH